MSIVTHMRTYSGQMVDVSNPNPDTILIEDIAHALSLAPRFCGHTNTFFSVAQHSYNCSRRAMKPEQKVALLHDASEYILVDIPTPVKNLIPEYKVIEARLMHVIAAKFGFKWPMPKTVEVIDRNMLEWEMHNLWGPTIKDLDFVPMAPEVARNFFLRRFHELG